MTTPLHRPLILARTPQARRLARLGASVATIALVAVMAQAGPTAAQVVRTTPAQAGAGPGGGPQFNVIMGGMANERREIADQFDADGDGMLNAAERAAAIAFLAANPEERGGPGGMAVRRGPGGPGGPMPIGPDGQPILPPGFPGAGAGVVLGGPDEPPPTGAVVATVPIEEAAVTEALRVAIAAQADEDFEGMPAEMKAGIVECMMTAIAGIPLADRHFLAEIGFDPTEAQIAQLEANNPGVEAAVRACFPVFVGGPAGGPGGPGGRAITETGTAGIALTPADVAAYPGVGLYDTSIIRTIFLDFGFDTWETEMAAFYNTDVEIPAVATVDGVDYANVGVRFRGNSSYGGVPAGLKRPIRVKFDSFVDGQDVEGYRTLNLLNGIGDPTFLRTALYSNIANQYIAAPKVNFVRLVVNGENWGVYSNQQHFNRDFVEDYFGFGGEGVRWQVPGSPGARGGMEYLGDNIDQYKTIYEIDNLDNDASWNALVAMFRVLNETPLENLEATLDPLLDIDGVLRFLALEVVLSNSDGYYARASDYYIYLDPEGRFHVAPHDMNEGFANEGRGGGQLDPLVGLDDATKPLRSRLLAVPELRARYLGYVLDIAENALDWSALGPVADDLHALIAEDVARDTRNLYSTEAFDTGYTELQEFIAARRDYLLATVPDLIAAIPLTAEEAAENAAAIAAPGPAAMAAADPAAAPAVTATGATTATFGLGEGPEGWTIAAGEGGALVTGAEATYFAFTALAEGFGDNKLDQCVAIDPAQPFEIAYTVFANVADPTGLSLRINPTFFATPADCLAAVAADDSDAALPGGRADEDLDFALGADNGLRLVTRTAADDAALAFAPAEIPTGATTVRLSVRARDRSEAAPAPTLGIAEVTLTQAGAQLVANPTFTAAPAP